MATIGRIGFGQVEPNHLSAQRTSQIYAQLPAADEIDVLEQGQFVKYDYAAGKVNFEGKGEWMLVFNEIKKYDERKQGDKDFALIKTDFTPGSKTISHYGVGPFPGQMTPRVFKTNVGDIYTTNCVGEAVKSGDAKYVGIELVKGDILKVDATGYLVKDTEATKSLESSQEPMLWQVVKEYTMPDGQPGIKIMRIR